MVKIRDGTMRRVYKRECVDIPWIPTLYVAVRREYLLTLRRDINFFLGLHGYGPLSCQLCFNVNCMSRELSEFTWRYIEDVYIAEMQFADFTARLAVRRYLQDRAPTRSADFQIFAIDNAPFNVAVATYVASMRLETEYSATTTIDATAVAAVETNSSCRIDLARYFHMCTWCEIDPLRGNYLRRIADEQVRLNSLPDNPLMELPVVSYDIETIARNENTLPRGVEVDQRLSSLAITIHPSASSATANAKWAEDAYATFVLAYAPSPTAQNEGGKSTTQTTTATTTTTTTTRSSAEQQSPDERLRAKKERHWRKRLDKWQEKMSSSKFVVTLYEREVDLLVSALELLSANQFLARVYKLADSDDARDLACILLGYNSWEYDHFFLAMRLHFYGFEREATMLMDTYGTEPRFSRSQISFDLMKHMIARYRAQVGSCSLANVARYFYASDAVERGLSAEERQCKMKFDAVAIRSLYYDTSTGLERFDKRRAFGDFATNVGLNMNRVLHYNAQDCAAVYFLYKNILFLDNVVEYARQFFVGIVEASYVGNNRLLSNAFTVQALALNGTVVAHQSTKLSTVRFMRYLADSANRHAPSELWQLENLRAAYDEVYILRVDKKSFVGGINSAVSAHYHRNQCAELDFKSYYPFLALQGLLSRETAHVLTVRQFLYRFAAGDSKTVDAMLSAGMIRIYDYEPDCQYVRKWHRRAATPSDDDDDDSFDDFATAEDELEHEESERQRDIGDCFVEGESWEECAQRLQSRKRRRLSSNGSIDHDAGDRDDASNRLRRTIRGVDRLASDTLRAHRGWYEGVELRNSVEIVDSSLDIDKRRIVVTMVPPDPDQKPFITQIWEYYLNQRAVYKRKMAIAEQTGDPSFRLYSALQLIYKILVNSMFGVLNFPQNVLYSPVVSALITKFSRKYFHETQTIVEQYYPAILQRKLRDVAPIRCKIVYRDTDGLMVFADRALSQDEARLMMEAVNENLHKTRPTMGGARLELELESAGADLYSSTIMGRKKYWKSSDSGKFVTKGFEKNAPPFIKHIVRLIQTNCHIAMHSVPSLREHAALRIALDDPRNFFLSMYDRLHQYYVQHGIADFTFGIMLNPRDGDNTDLGRFIQNMLHNYDYDVGNRVPCIYVLDPANIGATVFRTKNDFDARVDRLNYYKSVRRFAIYFLQLIEGFKRCGGSDDRDEHIDDRTWRERFAMSGKRFDDCLVDAYGDWLSVTNSEISRKYDPVFEIASSCAVPNEEHQRQLRETIERHTVIKPLRIF